MKVFYRETNALWKKKKELKSFYSCMRTINPESPILWLPGYHRGRNLLPENNSIPALIKEPSFTPWVSKFRLDSTHTAYFYEQSDPASALEDGTQWIKLWWHNFTLKCIPKIIWAMDRWTICGKANMVTCLLKNSGDGFTVCIIKFFQLSVCFKFS